MVCLYIPHMPFGVKIDTVSPASERTINIAYRLVAVISLPLLIIGCGYGCRLFDVLLLSTVFRQLIMLASTKRLPSKSTVNTDSYLWDIEQFSENTFQLYDKSSQKLGKINTIKGLRSSKFTLSFMRDGELKKVALYLWLTQEITDDKDGTWLKLSLTDSDIWFHEYDDCNGIRTDSRNICTAWISVSQKECVSTLTGGVFSYPRKTFFSNPKFVLLEELLDKRRGLLRGDSLSIVCEVHAFTNDVGYVNNWLFHPLKPVVVRNMKHTLTCDLKQLLDTGENSDVTLVASDGEEFPAHTLILSSRSKVFSAMFNLNMKEKQEKRVNIDDLTSKAVAGLLDFVYTDVVSDISTMAPELLSAAHKYDIPRLTLLCEEAMASDLEITNAAEYFLFADIHGVSQLRTAAKHFIATHFKPVKATDGWKKLMNHRPQLADEIVDELADVMAQLVS